MLKQAAKRFLASNYPQILFTYKAAVMRRRFKAEFSARQANSRTSLFATGLPEVLDGPFAGMKYLDEIVWGPIEGKWIGVYERELHSILADALKKPYAAIIDVGSAEGYYAVGLARARPDVRVISYDVDPWSRKQQARLAGLNQVSNLDIRTFCDHSALEADLSSRSLLICDAEGYEYTLLDLARVPALATTDILVEVHDDLTLDLNIEAGVRLLLARTSSTHRQRVLSCTPRIVDDVSTIVRGKVSDAELLTMIDEHRSPAQKWLWLEAH